MAKIGVFDSGLGGLSIVRKLIEKNSEHEIVYLGDTAHLPYGSKSIEKIKEFSQKALNFLTGKKVDIIVIACNTVSSVALPFLREIYKVPLIGVVESGVAAALEEQKNRICIIGTHNTVNSRRYEQLLYESDKNLKINSKPCPLFVPLVEEGIVSGEIAKLIVEKYLSEYKNKIDLLILGCTHYPALSQVISNFFENRVMLVDASSQISKYIKKLKLKKSHSRKCLHEFYVTDRPENFKKLAGLFLESSIKNAKTVNLN
ncbi:MAG: glutamate racemase [Candidatus Muiribacteriota bacterium]